MLNYITQLYLEDSELQDSLRPFIAAAPNGLNSLVTLPPETIKLMLTHPGKVCVIEPTKFLVGLENVDTEGYTVYDRTFTKLYRVYQDLKDNPDDDLSIPHNRRMTFGYHTYDAMWLLALNHGDMFYIGYDSQDLIPSTHLVIMLHPAVSGGL